MGLVTTRNRVVTPEKILRSDFDGEILPAFIIMYRVFRYGRASSHWGLNERGPRLLEAAATQSGGRWLSRVASESPGKGRCTRPSSESSASVLLHSGKTALSLSSHVPVTYVARPRATLDARCGILVSTMVMVCYVTAHCAAPRIDNDTSIRPASGIRVRTCKSRVRVPHRPRNRTSSSGYWSRGRGGGSRRNARENY